MTILLSMCADCAALLVCVLVQAEGEDNLKKMQLMELAILNGTYRDANVKTRKDDIIINMWRRAGGRQRRGLGTGVHCIFEQSLCFSC